MNLARWLKCLSTLAVGSCVWLGPLNGRAADSRTGAEPQPGTIDLTREQLLDHIRGGWTGMLIGGIEGLAHEFKYIEEPRASLPDYPFLPDGARSDDDNDFEWTHLCFMDKEGDPQDSLSPHRRNLEGQHEPRALGRQPPGAQTHGPGHRPAGNGQPGAQLVCALQPQRPVLCRGLRHDRAGHAADRGGPRACITPASRSRANRCRPRVTGPR